MIIMTGSIITEEKIIEDEDLLCTMNPEATSTGFIVHHNYQFLSFGRSCTFALLFILFLKCSFFSCTFPNIFLNLSITFCYQQHFSSLTRPLLLHCDYCNRASFVSLSSDYQVAPSLTRFQQKLGDATGNWHSGDIMSGTFPGNRSDLVEKIDRSGPFWWKRS